MRAGGLMRNAALSSAGQRQLMAWLAFEAAASPRRHRRQPASALTLFYAAQQWLDIAQIWCGCIAHLIASKIFRASADFA